MRKKMKYFSLLCMFALVAAGFARADSIYYLTEGLGTMSSVPTSTLCGVVTNCFGKVDVSLVTGGAQVAVTLTSGVDFVSTGNANSHETFAFNLPSTFTLSDLSLPTGWTDAVSGTEAGYGTFSFYYECGTNCSNPGASTLDSLTFTVAGADLSSFLTLAAAGNSFDTGEGNTSFAADVINHNADGNPTGIVADDGPNTPPVPEPSSLLLLGTGIFAAALFLRQRSAHSRA